jgi:hypothetical protein
MDASETIFINVGGVYFQTGRATLRDSGSALLASLLEFDNPFLDRDPALFAFVINFLRTGTLQVFGDGARVLEPLMAEASFYGLPQLELQIRGAHTAARPRRAAAAAPPRSDSPRR